MHKILPKAKKQQKQVYKGDCSLSTKKNDLGLKLNKWAVHSLLALPIVREGKYLQENVGHNEDIEVNIRTGTSVDKPVPELVAGLITFHRPSHTTATPAHTPEQSLFCILFSVTQYCYKTLLRHLLWFVWRAPLKRWQLTDNQGSVYFKQNKQKQTKKTTKDLYLLG